MSGRIINGDSREAIPLVPVHLVITSPPYNVGVDYEGHDDVQSAREWYKLMEDVLSVAWERLVLGGRMCVNVQHESGRSPAVPTGFLIQDIMEKFFAGYNRGTIVWDKSAGAGPRTSWGSWQSPANPVLRGEYEVIYVYSKGSLALEGDTEPDISKQEFLTATKDVWRDTGSVTNEVRRSDGDVIGSHPAPFPVKLAQRLIQLYSFPGQMVLDPFFGSGTTGLAADALGRDWIGVEQSREYCELAAKRIAPFEGMEVPIE